MNRAGLRALALIAIAVALYSFVGVAYTVDELQTIVENEFIEEISKAAGLALAGHYAATMTVDELTELAENGLTDGLKIAGQAALDLLNDPVQGLLLPLFVDATIEDLNAYVKDLAINGATAEERQVAADAYYFLIRGALTVDQLEIDVVTNDNDELALAAGYYLANYYATWDKREKSFLEDLAINGETAAQRLAGAGALAAILIDEGELTAAQVETLILEHTLWHPDLAAAYQMVLAYLYSQ